MSDQRKAIIISTGMDNLPLLEKLQQSETFTATSLNRIKGLYAKFSAEKAAIEKVENDASLARLNKNMAEKAAVTKAWIEKDAAFRAIASGSGGAGSGFKTAEHVALEAAGTTAGGYAGVKLAGKQAEHAAEKGAIDSVARREILVMTREGLSGRWKNFFSSFSIFIQHLGVSVPTLLKFAGAVAALAGSVFDAYNVFKLSKVRFEASRAAIAETGTKYSLRVQTAGLGGSIQNLIDESENSGHITGTQADRLRTMTTNGSSEQLRAAQRFLLEAEAKAAERKAAAEKAAAEHAAAVAVATADTLESEKLQAELLKKKEEIQGRIDRLREQHAQIFRDRLAIDTETPTLEQLAGRGYAKNLNAQYGEGGQYDLAAGNGPFAAAAQQALLAQKQQQWDIIHGNAIYNQDGQLIGGQAFEDRKRRISAENFLAGAGLQTPAMQMAAMGKNLAAIETSIDKLEKAATGEGIHIDDTN